MLSKYDLFARAKAEMKGDKLGGRIYLDDSLLQELLDELYGYFLRKFDIRRIRRGSARELAPVRLAG